MSQSQIHDDIRGCVDDGDRDHVDIATAVIAAFDGDDLAAYVMPAVQEVAFRLVRDRVRAQERQWTASRRPHRTRPDPIVRRQLRALRKVDEPFRIGDGKTVMWSEATVEQHEARIAWQRRQVAGIQADIALHQAAIDLIEDYGVTCLDEIPGWYERLGERFGGEPEAA